MSSSVYIDNKGKDILILGKGPTQRLDCRERTELKGVVKYFSADFNPIGTNDILDIHKNLTETTWYNNVQVN